MGFIPVDFGELIGAIFRFDPRYALFLPPAALSVLLAKAVQLPYRGGFGNGFDCRDWWNDTDTIDQVSRC